MDSKAQAFAVIQQMPPGVSMAQIVAELTVRFGPFDGEDEPLTEEEWEAAWIPEIERRLEDLRSGKTVGIPAEEVMRRMREKYG